MKIYEDDGCTCKINDISAINGIVFVEFIAGKTSGVNYL